MLPPAQLIVVIQSYPAIDPSNPALSAKGKVIVVIGGGRGIGKYIALAFARAGAQSIALMGRDSSNLQSNSSEICALSPQTNTATYSVDVTDPRATLSTLQSVKSQFGSIDVVVSSVGYLPAVNVGIKDSEFDDWWLGYEVNVRGTFTAVQAFLRTAPHGATFISLSSAAAHLPRMPGYSSYSSSKMAIAKFLEDVHAEHPEYRIFNYHPGIVVTDMNIKAGFPAQDESESSKRYIITH